MEDIQYSDLDLVLHLFIYSSPWYSVSGFPKQERKLFHQLHGSLRPQTTDSLLDKQKCWVVNMIPQFLSFPHSRYILFFGFEGILGKFMSNWEWYFAESYCGEWHF